MTAFSKTAGRPKIRTPAPAPPEIRPDRPPRLTPEQTAAPGIQIKHLRQNLDLGIAVKGAKAVFPFFHPLHHLHPPLLLLARKRRSAIFPETGHSLGDHRYPASTCNGITRWLPAMTPLRKLAVIPDSYVYIFIQGTFWSRQVLPIRH
jgi:hypothetical protein